MLRISYKRQLTVGVSPDRDIACWSNLGMVYSALKEEEEEEEQLNKILCLKKKSICVTNISNTFSQETQRALESYN